jgi:tryptophan-rich sensory protein
MTAAAAGVGSLGTDPESEWYQSIEKPSWQPPSVAFPLVWTPLYVAIAYGTVGSLTRADPRNVGGCWP